VTNKRNQNQKRPVVYSRRGDHTTAYDSPQIHEAVKSASVLMGTLKPQSNGPLYSNTVIGTVAVDGWAVTFRTTRRDLGGLRPRQVPSSLYPPINCQCTNFILFDVALLESQVLKGVDSTSLHLSRQLTFSTALHSSIVILPEARHLRHK